MARYADTSKYTQEEFDLWDKIIKLNGQTFLTKKDLPFVVTVKGNEIFVDRRKKSITRAAVNSAYHRYKESGCSCGPKKLNVFGASYLWPILREIVEPEC